MTDDTDFRDLMFLDENLPASGIARWLPTAVVITAVAGFVTLAWYAYHAGTQSLKDDDLLVVEADKTPVKEKPADPGGMKFPNQDKTIFETFSAGQQPPKVERVLPKPEEPMSKDDDTSGTETWINDKHKADNGKPEQVIGTEEKKPDTVAAKTPEPAANDDKTITYVAPVVEKAPAPFAVPVPEKKEEKVAPAKAKEAPAPTPKAIKAATPAGNAKVQLGAYRSEKEARDAWANIQQKFGALSGKEPTIVKADLGAKGVYYRLRVNGVGATADAKALCGKLTVAKQACILPTD